jgi:RND superfamily putative drug exporter
VALIAWVPAPRIPTLLADDDTGFLPADMPSQRASATLEEEFPDHAPASSAAIVFVRETGLTLADRRMIADIAAELRARCDELDWRIHAAATAPFLEGLLESPDGRAAIISVDLPAEFLTHSTVRRVRIIREVVDAHRESVDTQEAGPGLEIEITGNGALGELLDANTKGDVDRTTAWAFAGVTIILLLIYRSPVAMLLPLVTLALSLMVALGILGRAAAAGWPINGLVEMFIIVILAGSGVDYCLFLFARFREELAGGTASASAVEIAVTRTGGAILASAGTNVVGLATLALARNRDLYTSGPTIAFAICVATFAVLTLTPSLMRMVGHYLVRPAKVHGTGAQHVGPTFQSVSGRSEEGSLWPLVARLATGRPVFVTLILIAVLIPTSIIGWGVEPLYDAYEEYPADSSFVRGAHLYEEHFLDCSGASESTLIVSADNRLDTQERLPALRASIDAVAAALDRQFPVLYQRDLNNPLDRPRARNTDQSSERKRRVDKPRAGAWGSDRVGMSAPIDIDPPRADESSAQVESAGRLAAGLVEQATEVFYIGLSGRTTRIDVGLRVEPRSARAMEMVPEIRSVARQALEQSGLPAVLGGATLGVDLAGDTPLYADIRDVRTRDFRVIAVVAVALIYSILVVLIHSPVQSAILVAATLVTYLATYGATWVIFTQCYGVSSLSYQLDFLLFIIILSLGQDYNIYVVARIREELRGRAPAAAIRRAVSKTGPVVSSCGIIMAAAFASMFSGSLLLMKEFAVALAMGILIDTFLVRPLLVPALILLVTQARNGRSIATPMRS